MKKQTSIKVLAHDYFRRGQLGLVSPDSESAYAEAMKFSQEFITFKDEVPEIKKDTYQVLIERQDGMLDLIFIHKTMLDYEVKEILIDWYKAVRWRYIFL